MVQFCAVSVVFVTRKKLSNKGIVDCCAILEK